MYKQIRHIAFGAWSSWHLFRRGQPTLGLGFLGSLGDELLATSAYVEWRKRGIPNVWMMTRNPEFYRNIAPSDCLLPEDLRYARICNDRGIPFHFIGYSKTLLDSDHDTPLARPLIAEICANAGLTGTIALRPYLKLGAAESSRITIPKNAIAIQSSSLSAKIPMRNKQWPVGRMQAVADYLRKQQHILIQIGVKTDPPLHDVIDFRGKTTPRETAVVLQQCRLFIGLVGFQMHLARAVECPSVIVYGGRETPALTGYSCNANVTNSPPCSPCWLRSSCSFEHQCMTDIPVESVISAVENKLSETRATLPVDSWLL